MNLIVAVNENWGIGKDNKLLFNLPADMKHFRSITMNKVVIMGENTYLSLPKRPLKDRKHIVLSFNKEFDGVQMARSIDECLKLARRYKTDDVFVCGGASIYQQMLPYCKKAYVTKIFSTRPADTFFPNLDLLGDWKVVFESKIMHDDNENVDFQFVEYIKSKREKL